MQMILCRTCTVLRQTSTRHPIGCCFLTHASLLVDWDATLALHVKAYAYGIKHMALAVSQAEEKAVNVTKTSGQTEAVAPQYAIVNMSSTVGVRGMPDIVRYATAKAGILGMTRQCAFDLGKHNIRCSTASQSNSPHPHPPVILAKSNGKLRLSMSFSLIMLNSVVFSFLFSQSSLASYPYIQYALTSQASPLLGRSWRSQSRSHD